MDKKVRPFLVAAKKHGAEVVMEGSPHIRVFYKGECVGIFSRGHRNSVGGADMARQKKKWKELGWL